VPRKEQRQKDKTGIVANAADWHAIALLQGCSERFR